VILLTLYLGTFNIYLDSQHCVLTELYIKVEAVLDYHPSSTPAMVLLKGSDVGFTLHIGQRVFHLQPRKLF